MSEKKGMSSNVGENSPTDETNKTIDALVDEALGTSKAPEQADKGLEDKEDDASESENLESSEGDEVEGDVDSEDSDASEEEEEVVPRSKHQKALEKQQRRIDELTNKIRQFEAKEQKKPETQAEKLEALGQNDLEELLDNTTDAIAEAKYQAKADGTDVSKKLEELQSLRRNIRQTMKDAPNRFVNKQTAVLDSVIAEVKDLDPSVTDRKGELWNTALRIYQSSPSLQKTVTGQGEAMRLAAEHFLSLRQSAQGLEKNSELTKKVNRLKQKTTLDGNVRKGNEQALQQRKVKDKAIGGTYDDKLAFVKTLVPDEFIQVG